MRFCDHLASSVASARQISSYTQTGASNKGQRNWLPFHKEFNLRNGPFCQSSGPASNDEIFFFSYTEHCPFIMFFQQRSASKAIQERDERSNVFKLIKKSTPFSFNFLGKTNKNMARWRFVKNQTGIYRTLPDSQDIVDQITGTFESTVSQILLGYCTFIQYSNQNLGM